MHPDTLEHPMTELFKITVIAFETLAAGVLIIGATVFLVRFINALLRGSKGNEAFRKFRHGFGRTLLLALDLLVAADIILTVALDLSFEALGMLGLLVLIRTFLHFILELEISGRWPWQGAHGAADDPEE
ncbi:MAG: DUF1622 domain-containing protein [Desulfobacterales bacterium]